MSAILRHRHPNRFTVLPNDAIRNPALSFRAVGVLAHLLSLPDGARVDSATLATAHKEGRDAVRAAFAELARHGYYRREVIRLPDGTLRTEVVVSSTPMNGDDAGRAGDGKSGVGPGPENPAPAGPAPVDPTSAGPTPDDQAAKDEGPTTEARFPPQPPRRAGGQEIRGGGAGPSTERRAIPPEPGPRPPSAALAGARRDSGQRSRARGTNPRAEAQHAESARLEAGAAARRAELEAATEARRAVERAAQLEAERFEAEALVVSAFVDDGQLAELVAVVRGGMAGPLARSSLAVARAVVAWCRTASARHPGPLGDAVTAGLAGGLAAGEGHPALELTLSPPEAVPLRRRIARLLERTDGA
jgi:hypothetical protein